MTGNDLIRAFVVLLAASGVSTAILAVAIKYKNGWLAALAVVPAACFWAFIFEQLVK